MERKRGASGKAGVHVQTALRGALPGPPAVGGGGGLTGGCRLTVAGSESPQGGRTGGWAAFPRAPEPEASPAPGIRGPRPIGTGCVPTRAALGHPPTTTGRLCVHTQSWRLRAVGTPGTPAAAYPPCPCTVWARRPHLTTHRHGGADQKWASRASPKPADSGRLVLVRHPSEGTTAGGGGWPQGLDDAK